MAILNRTMDDIGYDGEYRGSIEKRIENCSYTLELIPMISLRYQEGMGVPVDIQKGIRLLEEGLAFVGDGDRDVGNYYSSLARAYLKAGRDGDYSRCIGEAARRGPFYIVNRMELKVAMSEGNPEDISTVACICEAIARRLTVARPELNRWAARFLELVGKAEDLDHYAVDALAVLPGSGLDDRNATAMARVRERLKGKVDSVENRGMLMRAIAEISLLESEEEYWAWMERAAMEWDQMALDRVLDSSKYDDVSLWVSAVSRCADVVGPSDVADVLKFNRPFLDFLALPKGVSDTYRQYAGEDGYTLAQDGLRMMVAGDYEGCVRCYLRSESAEKHLASAVARIFLDGLSTLADRDLAARIMGGCGDSLIGNAKNDPDLRKEIAARFGIGVDEHGVLKS